MFLFVEIRINFHWSALPHDFDLDWVAKYYHIHDFRSKPLVFALESVALAIGQGPPSPLRLEQI